MQAGKLWKCAAAHVASQLLAWLWQAFAVRGGSRDFPVPFPRTAAGKFMTLCVSNPSTYELEIMHPLFYATFICFLFCSSFLKTLWEYYNSTSNPAVALVLLSLLFTLYLRFLHLFLDLPGFYLRFNGFSSVIFLDFYL